MDISIIIPFYNEEESLRELYQWIKRVMDENGYSYEIIFVDDGSTDGSWNIITELKTESDRIHAIKFRRNYGKSPALQCAFQKAEGDVVITMDADLQDSPEEIPELYRMIKEEGYDLVSGWKKKRYDALLTKNLPSKLFNATARCVSGIKLHDFNCGLKAYRKDVVKISNCITRCTVIFPFWPKVPVLPRSGKNRYSINRENTAKASSGQVVFLTVISI
jgi:glycosyltransferase involved in cell wall biosynthesis